MTAQETVREYHVVMGIPYSDVGVYAPSPDLVELRISLIEEEFTEVMTELQYMLEGEGNAERLAKELADLLYTVYGAGVELGIDLDVALAEVHRSNMSKLGPDGKPTMRADGKVLKGLNFSPANMSGSLRA